MEQTQIIQVNYPTQYQKQLISSKTLITINQILAQQELTQIKIKRIIITQSCIHHKSITHYININSIYMQQLKELTFELCKISVANSRKGVKSPNIFLNKKYVQVQISQKQQKKCPVSTYHIIIKASNQHELQTKHLKLNLTSLITDFKPTQKLQTAPKTISHQIQSVAYLYRTNLQQPSCTHTQQIFTLNLYLQFLIILKIHIGSSSLKNHQDQKYCNFVILLTLFLRQILLKSEAQQMINIQ
eukprot:TRINITY_DN4136_c0_g1_i1.p1 TRINITY_DN4136_c0_g1~~TRINITY_DN4136_c0_g1_i1.p1  ORF type:complete len:244 (+),score=-13.46 TRINITY_DN4136_c0_g1_i1:70-801(+)